MRQPKKVYLLNYNGNGNGDGDGNGDGNGNGYGNGNGDGNGNGIYNAKVFGEWFEVSHELENSLCNNLPARLYNKMDKEFLQRVTNLECLRSLREKIGLERYIRLFDATVINEQVDHQGNQMKLYRYDEKGTKVILLEVICPSTKRMYHLYPPNQKAKTCFEAKASTFSNKPIKFRHGDCAFIEVGKLYEYPICES
jgi:hypothetical protein